MKEKEYDAISEDMIDKEITLIGLAVDAELEPEHRRYAQLATLLRGKTLIDVDCWSRVPGTPLSPGQIEQQLRARLAALQEN